MRKKERKVIWLIVFDQAIKLLALQKGIAFINRGVAFGMVFPFFLSVLLIGFFAFIYFFKKQNSFSLLLILVGGISNLIDRLIRGGVVDFISLPLIPVFNLADVIICAGAGLFFIDTLRKSKV